MPIRKIKDPEAVLDYGWDWAAKGWLEDGETITNSSWSIDPSGELTIESTSQTDSKTLAWVSGGVDGERYLLTNHITTSAGREDDRSFLIVVRDR